jgi:NAD(P)-dependent dehydrogenase (short-subunit alcohol dehydrogenase family)
VTDLTDRTVLVTGASKGIGAAIAAALVGKGCRVVAHYGGDRPGAEQAVASAVPGRARLVQADLAERGGADRLWSEALAWAGRIDALVNNAAVMPMTGGIDDSDEAWDDAWELCQAVNVLSATRLMRHAVRHYRAAGGGVLVTMSSWAAQRGSGTAGLLAYSASKGAVLAATKTIARNYARDGVLAYVVAPGVVNTRMSEVASASMGGPAAVAAGLAMGEWVPPDEIGSLVAYLVSGECRHLSGATLDVNGASYIR